MLRFLCDSCYACTPPTRMNLAPRCVTRSLATCMAYTKGAKQRHHQRGGVGVEGVFGQVKACLAGGSDWKDSSLRLFTAPFGRSCSGGYPIVTNGVFFLFHCPLIPQKVCKTCRIKRIKRICSLLQKCPKVCKTCQIKKIKQNCSPPPAHPPVPIDRHPLPPRR